VREGPGKCALAYNSLGRFCGSLSDWQFRDTGANLIHLPLPSAPRWCACATSRPTGRAACRKATQNASSWSRACRLRLRGRTVRVPVNDPQAHFEFVTLLEPISLLERAKRVLIGSQGQSKGTEDAIFSRCWLHARMSPAALGTPAWNIDIQVDKQA
jgi:hypothetical protein